MGKLFFVILLLIFIFIGGCVQQEPKEENVPINVSEIKEEAKEKAPVSEEEPKEQKPEEQVAETKTPSDSITMVNLSSGAVIKIIGLV